MTSLSSQGMREGDHEISEITFDVGTLNSSDNQTVDLNIKIPSFLELDGTMEDAITFVGVDITGRVDYSDLGGGHYMVRFKSNPTQPDPATGNPVGTAINNLDFKFKVKTGSCAGANISGEIEYWLDYNLGGNTPIRPTLKKIAKLYQPVTLYCVSEGIRMDGFSLYRITRGLKDSDENYVPDDGTPALDDEIRHNVFLKNDEGKIIVKGTTLGVYNNLYMLLETSFKMRNDVIKLTGSPTIKIGNNAEEDVSLTNFSNDSLFYVKYEKPVPANTEVTITIPFITTSANNLTKAFDIELYVSNNTQADPFNPTNRVGTDKMGRVMIVYLEAFATDKSNEVFTNNVTRTNVTLPYFDNYHGNNFYTPYFKNEIRRTAKPLTYAFELPVGYLLKSDLTISNTQRRDQHLKDNPKQIIPLQKSEKMTNGNILYTFDFSSVFTDDVNTQAQADDLPANKWMHPDDVFYFNFLIDVQATKGAPDLKSVRTTITYKDAVENDSIMTRVKDFAMNYTGDRTVLNISPDTIKGYDTILHIPVAGVGNPNAYNTDMWIYVEGKVKNVSATLSAGGGPVISGQGIEGKWIALGTVNRNTTPNYKISFEPINPFCSLDSVKVYSVSRFQEPTWAPDMSLPVDPPRCSK